MKGLVRCRAEQTELQTSLHMTVLLWARVVAEDGSVDLERGPALAAMKPLL